MSSQLPPSSVYSFSKKLKTEFEPVLKFFEVTPTGNLFQDVAQLAQAIENAQIDEKLTRFFFDFYDKDGNNSIDRNEFRTLVRDIGEAMEQEPIMMMNEQQLNEAMDALDKDGSGVIEWKEFKGWFDEVMRAKQQE